TTAAPPFKRILIISGNFCPRKAAADGGRAADMLSAETIAAPPFKKILIISGNFCPRKASADGGKGGGYAIRRNQEVSQIYSKSFKSSAFILQIWADSYDFCPGKGHSARGR
ncbi:MAG: hypothetical protein IJV24_02975, partial [Prevotella sp.]|nr:hypothetical protein [Prevotella sp.]